MRTIIILAILATPAMATAGGLGLFSNATQKPHGSCETCCPEVKCVPVTRHCFEVECEEICVPGVTFYLNRLLHRCKGKGDCCCADFCPNPGKVKCVKTFKKVEYECGEKIVCDWSLSGKGKRGGK